MNGKVNAREKIMEAAVTAFADRGYHHTAMDDIVRRTAISKGGLYFHFASKESLFFAVLDRLADRLVSRIKRNVAQQEGAVAKLDMALTTVLESLGKRRRLAKLMLVQGYSMGNPFEKKRMDIYAQFSSLIKDNLDQALEEGSIAHIYTNVAASIWLGAINEILIQWLYTGEPEPIREALPALRTILLAGIGVKVY